MSHETSTIMSAMRRIRDGELLLPAIQRDFVWASDRIYALLDSIMRSYPFGTLLFWNTKQRLQYRRFVEQWEEGFRPTFEIKQQGHRSTLVLDGQQRLQSLYLSTLGTYDHGTMHLDLLSGVRPQDSSEPMYRFEFLPAAEAARRNEAAHSQQLWVALPDIVGIREPDLLTARAHGYQMQAGVGPDSEVGQRLSRNLTRVYWRFNAQPVLNHFTVDKEYGDDGLITSLDEILEIFVRVNSGGEVLSRSDLMFSLIQLNWEGAADAIADLCEELNAKANLRFDKDFVLRCALVCTGRGARYDVNKLRDKETIEAIQQAFPDIARAIVAIVDMCINTAKLQDDRILRAYNTLIPFIYFAYLQPGQQLRSEGMLMAMNQSLYLSLMTRVFSRYADSRIDQAVRGVLAVAHQQQPGIFPLRELKRFVGEREGHSEVDDWLLQNNIPLLMNILEGGSQLPEGQRRYRPEYDHIFPQQALRSQGVAEDKINHYANFRLVSKLQNIWKTNQDPEPYFAGQPEVMARYLIPADLLNYDRYDDFLAARREMIWQRVNEFLGISEEQEPMAGKAPEAPEQAESEVVGVPSSAESAKPAPAPASSGRQHEPRTIEAVRARAIANGTGPAFDAILETAQELGLHPRPYVNYMVYVPPQDRRRVLFNIPVRRGGDGRIYGWAHAGNFEHWCQIPAQRLHEVLGATEHGVIPIAPEEVDSFCQRLRQLFRSEEESS